ncbi:MAG: metallophosphoesterase [Patescibacteria group bacterium]|jgi:Icc-related predicted phosphoesterase
MKAFLFSDLHVNYKQLSNLLKFLAGNKEIDFVICAGDTVNMGEPVGFMETFIDVIDKIGKPFFWVPGNNDFGRAYYKLSAKYPSLEGRVAEEGGRKFTGVGGSPASWAGQYAGEKLIDKQLIGGSIFVSHVPPPGVHNYRHEDCNSPTAKKLSDSPLVHICGHVHHQWGCAYLGSTKIIKLAAFEYGQYAILDLENLAVKFKHF